MPLEESDALARAKAEFLALLGHELRTPVSAVVGMVEVLRALPLPQEAREVVDGVHRSTRLLKAFTDDLLDLARLETDRLDLDERPMSVRAVLEEVIDPLQQQVRLKGVLLVAAAAPDLPPYVVGDAGRLRQVLTNLVGNAVKFTERGEVVVAASRSGDFLEISVADTGPGLSTEDRERIFAPFVQVDSSSGRRHEGAGLGLAVASRLVARMGGTLDLSSEPGRGTRFRLRLPLVPAPDPGTAEAVPPLAVRRVAVAAPSPESTAVLGWMLAAAGASAVPSTLDDLISGMLEVDAAVWCDDSHDPAATARGEAVMRALGPDRPAVMVSTTDPRRGVVRGPAMITAPLTLRRLVAVLNQERTGVRGAPVAVPRLPGGRVLLAEDNEVNQGVFRRMISLLGVECDVVGDGEAAVRAVLDGPGYDLVLMDMQMPGTDGLAATRRLRAAGRDLPILALTATGLRGDQERCLDAGMDGYLSKPITIAELHQALGRYLDSPRPARPSAAPAVDLAVLRDLEDQLGDRTLVTIAVSTYLTELDGRRAALTGALARRDRDALRAAAHTLKSSSALLGARELASACATIETRAGDAPDDELATLVGAVERGATGTATALAEYAAGGPR